LHGCALALADAVSLGAGGAVTSLFVPLLPADAPSGAKTAIVVETRDPELVARFSRLAPGAPAAEARLSREVTGLVRRGAEIGRERREELLQSFPSTAVASDFVVVSENETRPIVWPAALTGLGLLAAAGALSRLRRRG